MELVSKLVSWLVIEVYLHVLHGRAFFLGRLSPFL